MEQDFKVFIDTNILVHSTLEDFEPEKNKETLLLLERLYLEKFEVFISTQTLREFYAVVTSSKFLVNALSPKSATKQIKFLLTTFTVLPVSISETLQLNELCTEYKIIGQKIHDTNIVATMLASGVKRLITYNKKDFVQFKEIIVLLPNEFMVDIAK